MDIDQSQNRMNRRALFAMLMAPACAGPPESPLGIAELFLEHYLISVDQERAMEIARGLAREKLEGEIHDVAGVRAAGATVARTDVPRYVLVEERPGERDATIFLFDISMPGDEDAASRRILVAVSPEDDSWAVTNYGFYPIR